MEKLTLFTFSSGSSRQPHEYEYDYSQYPKNLDDYNDYDRKIDMDMDSGEELVKNKTKLKENGPRLKNPRSK